MSQPRVLLVEGDALIRRLVVLALTDEAIDPLQRVERARLAPADAPAAASGPAVRALDRL